MSFKLTTIGQYASVQGGYAFKSQDFSSSGFRPVLKIKNVRHGHIDYSDVAYVSEDIANGCKRWETTTGDILISMTGSGPSAPESLVGRVARVWNSEPKSLINQRVGRIVLKDDNAIDKDFIFYVLSLRETQEYLVSNSTGSANQVNINAKTIESVSCPIVTFEESQQIASIFKTLDRRIRLLRETNATLEAIAQALFKSWFVDFDPVHANAGTQTPSLPAEIQALFPSRLVESPQGLIPEGWEVKQLGDVTSYLSRGISPKYVDQGGVCVINQKCIRDFSIDLSKARRHDPNQRKIDGRELVVGDVLVNSTGVGTLGRVAQVLELLETTIVDSHVTVVRAETCLGWIYLGQALMRKQPEIEAMGEGTTGQTELARSKLGLLPIICPSQAVLKHFDLIILPLKQSIAVNQSKIKALANLRDTLLPRLISGQLRLPEAEAVLAEVG